MDQKNCYFTHTHTEKFKNPSQKLSIRGEKMDFGIEEDTYDGPIRPYGCWEDSPWPGLVP